MRQKFEEYSAEIEINIYICNDPLIPFKVQHNPSEIMRSLSEGDVKAFRTVYDRYALPLRFFAVKYLGDVAAVDDIVQDCFVQLWERRTEFREHKGMRFYLYQSVRNACLNVIRHDEVRSKFAAKKVQEPESDDTFMEKYMEAEAIELIFSAIEELPPAARQVYKLSLEGFTREEIGTKLNISVNTVKKHRSNANEFLRSRLKNLVSIVPFMFLS